MMTGWKTWASALGAIALGIYEITEGRVEDGIGHIAVGFGLIGIGHKIEKFF